MPRRPFTEEARRRAEVKAAGEQGRDEAWQEGYAAGWDEGHQAKIAGPLSIDDVRNMTPDEINARWEEVAQAMEEAR
jgi:flagellar biosynthesis/type III secretory pathway protein FliH